MTIFIFWVLCAAATAFIADKRGLPVGKFALIGLLLGLIGVVVACVAPVPTSTYGGKAAKNAADYDRRAAMSRPIRKGL
jgi:hypothetical protein